MGGKNCVIVDADADLDDVVPALVYSAFGFAGQKCSAAARALVHERVTDTLIERLHGAVDPLLIDQAERFGVDVPPVIEAAAQAAHRGLHRRPPTSRARASTSPARRRPHGHFVAPRRDRRPPRSDRASPRRRSSAPCSPSRRCSSIDEALRRSSSAQPFALTGGLFSRDPRHGRPRSSRRSPVGNLYVNRHITGAMVARQPFGGNRLSRHRHQGGRRRLPAAVRRAARGDRGHDAPRPSGLSEDALQEIVDALSVRLGRPVLVDDVELRPLAYSSQFGELDTLRTASILGRAAPDGRATCCSATASATPPSPCTSRRTPRTGWRRGCASRSCAASAGSATCGCSRTAPSRARICDLARTVGRRGRRRCCRPRPTPSSIGAGASRSCSPRCSPAEADAAAATLEPTATCRSARSIVCVGARGGRCGARTPAKHALCGEADGRAIVAAARPRGRQLTEALAGTGDAIEELRDAPLLTPPRAGRAAATAASTRWDDLRAQRLLSALPPTALGDLPDGVRALLDGTSSSC